MQDFTIARQMMVDCQIRPNDVTDLRLIDAFLQVPRERFLPPAKAALAYLDIDLPLGSGSPQRAMIQPMVLAKLLQVASVTPADRVLDVGAATGYASAVLAQVAGSVVALEENPSLNRVDVPGVTAVNGPLHNGWAALAPYDLILVEGAVEVAPEALFAQLREAGRLVCVLGSGPDSKAMLYRKENGDVSGRPVFDATAPVLPGFTKMAAFTF